jgi:citrate synthase
VAYLFLHGRLPTPSERDRFVRDLAGRRGLSVAATAVLREAAKAQTPPMDALRMATPLLSLGRADDPLEAAMDAIAAFPTIVGAYWRLRGGQAPLPVRSDLAHAAHYLYQLSGAEPSAERARALETYLNTVCDHGLNASTFAARVIASTRSDVISAITGAVGALKGPLHGGAPAARAQAGAAARHERGVLHRAVVTRNRPAARIVHPHLRRRARRRLVGALCGAVA